MKLEVYCGESVFWSGEIGQKKIRTIKPKRPELKVYGQMTMPKEIGQCTASEAA